MATERFVLSDIGEGIAEVEIVKWFKQKGDVVRQFEPLLEVQSDKANVEITSRFDGVLTDITCLDGDIAKVGEVLCVIESGDSSGDKSATDDSQHESARKSEEGTDAQFDARLSTSHSERPHAIPSVRHLAKKHSIDLTRVAGTGRDGRIMKHDILAHLNRAEIDIARADTCESMPPRSMPEAGVAPASLEEAEIEHRVKPVHGLQRIMVKTMTASAAIPQLALTEQICVDALEEIRDRICENLGSSGLDRMTFLPVLLKMTSLALRQFPELNASVDDTCTEMTYHRSHNISVAMHTSRGLVVPVVKRVETLNVLDIALELKRLSEAARSSKLSPEELAGGTFAFSNIGAISGRTAHPLVLPPQVAIGAVGRAFTSLAWKDGRAVPTRVLHVTWSADHRVIDGATVALFNKRWKELVENPTSALVELR